MTIRFNWGAGIALTYGAFALATTGFVVFAMGRPVALVRADYYAESLRQDQRTEAVQNARDLGSAVSIVNTDGRHLIVSFPVEQAPGARGTITLYRASDATADRMFDVAPDGDGRQRLSLVGLPAGQWLVQLQWKARDREYYVEQPVVAQ
jgi:hypothetical protein